LLLHVQFLQVFACNGTLKLHNEYIAPELSFTFEAVSLQFQSCVLQCIE